MSQYTKQYQDFFRDSEAGQEVIKSLESIAKAEQTEASEVTDIQESFAHTQRAKGVQMAVNKINSLLVEAKKSM